jgi:hypothetical protein
MSPEIGAMMSLLSPLIASGSVTSSMLGHAPSARAQHEGIILSSSCAHVAQQRVSKGLLPTRVAVR